MNEANSNVYSKVYDLSLGLCGSRRGQSNLYATEQWWELIDTDVDLEHLGNARAQPRERWV